MTNPPDAFDRLPPHSIESEMCCLASMILSREMALEIIPRLDPVDFYLTDHSIIYSIIRRRTIEGKPIDAVILRDVLKEENQLDIIGGSAYIGRILGTVPSASHGIEYADRVALRARQRDCIALGEDMMRRGYAQNDPNEVLDEVQGIITGIRTRGHNDKVSTLHEITKLAADDVRDPNRRDNVSYGFPSMDQATGGHGPGEFVVMGARPSMGKSTLSRQIGVLSVMPEIMNPVCPTLYFSLEEHPTKVGRNVLSWWTQIQNSRMRSGDIAAHEWEMIDGQVAAFKGAPFYFVRGVNKAEAIRSMSLSYASRFGVKRIIVDYLQKVQAGGKSDFEKATESCRAISSIAHEHGIRTIAMAQLSRAATMRDSTRPTMTDLRSTGQIEQDADVIMLLHREDYYHKGEMGYVNTNQAEVIIEKARDGPAGISIFLESCLEYQCFQENQSPPDSGKYATGDQGNLL